MQDKWIHISEKLPEEFEEVLIFNCTHEIGRYNKVKGYFEEWGLTCFETMDWIKAGPQPKYWQPLPPPPPTED